MFTRGQDGSHGLHCKIVFSKIASCGNDATNPRLPTELEGLLNLDTSADQQYIHHSQAISTPDSDFGNRRSQYFSPLQIKQILLTSGVHICCNPDFPPLIATRSTSPELRNGFRFRFGGDNRARGETLKPSFSAPRLRPTCCTISLNNASASEASCSDRATRSSWECVRTRLSWKLSEGCESAPGLSGESEPSDASLCAGLGR